MLKIDISSNYNLRIDITNCMRILSEILNRQLYDNCCLESILIFMIFYVSISHPFVGFHLCHSIGWCRRT